MLQITEPNEKKKSQTVIGIDLGTTHSLVAQANGNEVTIFTDEKGSTVLPSIVFYENGKTPVVGEQALKNNQYQNTAGHSETERNTVASVKRLMGIGKADVQKYAQHEIYRLIVDGENIALRIGGKELSPAEISADILKALKSRAEKKLGETVESAIITVPAYFNDTQRNETKIAARLAGLNVLRLLSEPTAAALAYGLDKNKEGTYLVYDMGGGTFDVSLLKLHNGIFQVIATGGDTWLGGDDIDKEIATHLESSGGHWPTRIKVARQLKEDLSEKESSQVTMADTTYELTRDTLQQLITPLIDKTITHVKDVLFEAKVDTVDGIIMVGGSTRIPAIQQKISETFHVPLLNDLNPDEIVVRGAALQAAALMGDGDSLLVDVTPLSLGIETAGGLVEKIIPRNTAIPVSQSQEFTTFKDGQTAMDIHILQGERETVDACRSLGKFRLTDIPPLPAGSAKIVVNYTLDADGLLTVSAQEQTTGHIQQVEINPTYGLEEDKVLEMLKSAFENASEDVKARSLKETQTELSNLIYACEKALEKDSGLLSEEEITSLYTFLEQAKKELDNDNVEELRHILSSLDESFAPFAEKRMNNALKKSVVGLSASQFE
jgi:molecular chaperone HscA